ncbi:DsbA family protein [Dyadobacter chenwenxiniae]|uniref:DsbA family protein n=1 Tax=Dyadobacter chenwenxiniae TaxID=2906456 RepID=A0A9X1PQW2_9BACT|nr:DsbA family protein [Dyadobacter chenwenxiniae]MCF0063276.1 DsbA family protein [Dyadobacter chenwenxiniae]UON85344.1 DsbA family protein [Dyadobacter chenwenxiniae]
MDLSNHQADRVKIVFYTDPLCCWSWALQPHWQRFIEAYKHQITYSYCLGGMIPDWTKYNDPFNSVSRPAQMGPIWMEAQHKTGAKINDMIWSQEEPPTSSYPACIAVKTAGLQSFEASEYYMQAVWKAVMVDALNISKKDVLLEAARGSSLLYPDVVDYERFLNDYDNAQSREAFRSDLRQVAYNRIGRFPTLTFTKSGKGLIMTGFRPYEALVDAFNQLLVVSQDQSVLP